MITDELIKAVKTEAALLRKHGKPEELANINFGDLDPFNAQMCIYGMATGDCFSPRALELFEKCAIPFSQSNVDFVAPNLNSFCNVEIKDSTREYYEGSLTDEEIKAASRDNYSAVEFYIAQEGANLIELTNFLSGQSNTLNL